jgi:hypothetical protein
MRTASTTIEAEAGRMKVGREFCEPVEVEMHLPGRFTRILLTRTLGQGMADGGISWELPTAAIPPELRGIGNRFLVHGTFGDSVITVIELPHLDRSRATAIRSMIAIEHLTWREIADACGERFGMSLPATEAAGLTMGWLAADTLGEDLNSPAWK